MRKYKKAIKKVLKDIICDICGKSCIDPICGLQDVGMAEYATLEALWGYCSKKDGESYNCDLCEDCFDKIKIYIDSIKTN